MSAPASLIAVLLLLACLCAGGRTAVVPSASRREAVQKGALLPLHRHRQHLERKTNAFYTELNRRPLVKRTILLSFYGDSKSAHRDPEAKAPHTNKWLCFFTAIPEPHCFGEWRKADA